MTMKVTVTATPKLVGKAAALAKLRMPTAISTQTPLTLQEGIQRIEAMAQRIDGYIRYMCEIAAVSNTSAEAKERAVLAFYQQMVIVESQLGRIHDELRLE